MGAWLHFTIGREKKKVNFFQLSLWQHLGFGNFADSHVFIIVIKLNSRMKVRPAGPSEIHHRVWFIILKCVLWWFSMLTHLLTTCIWFPKYKYLKTKNFINYFLKRNKTLKEMIPKRESNMGPQKSSGLTPSIYN